MGDTGLRSHSLSSPGVPNIWGAFRPTGIFCSNHQPNVLSQTWGHLRSPVYHKNWGKSGYRGVDGEVPLVLLRSYRRRLPDWEATLIREFGAFMSPLFTDSWPQLKELEQWMFFSLGFLFQWSAWASRPTCRMVSHICGILTPPRQWPH